jgi:hypothetical protein
MCDQQMHDIQSARLVKLALCASVFQTTHAAHQTDEASTHERRAQLGAIHQT